MEYAGEVCKTKANQWSWVIYMDGKDIARGAGFPSEYDAEQALLEELTDYQLRDKEDAS